MYLTHIMILNLSRNLHVVTPSVRFLCIPNVNTKAFTMYRLVMALSERGHCLNSNPFWKYNPELSVITFSVNKANVRKKGQRMRKKLRRLIHRFRCMILLR